MRSSREEILARIRAAVSEGHPPPLGWRDVTTGTTPTGQGPYELWAWAALAAAGAPATERFVREVHAAGAQTSTAVDVLGCARAIDDFVVQVGATEVVVHDEPLARAVAAHVSKASCRPARDESDPRGGVVCSLLAATGALADTGSVVVVTRSAADRRLPYAVQACVVVVPVDRIDPTLAAPMLARLAAQAREPGGGEAVIITGPSRTADIEKRLIIGAHGPRRLAIVVLEQPPAPLRGAGR